MAGFTVPGAQGISEWQSPIKGFIATCVEASEAVITGIYGVLPTNPQSTLRLAYDQIARGEAKSSGASYVGSAGQQLTRLGIANTDIEGRSNIAGRNWTDIINQALLQHKPVLAGFTNAQALKDTRTGARPDLGVHGHGVTIVGVDQAGSGYLVADPNTAPGSGFMDYSPSNLQAAGLSSLIVPNQAPGAVQPANSGISPAVKPPSGNPGGPIGVPGGKVTQQAAASSIPAEMQQIYNNILSHFPNSLGDVATRIGLIFIAGILLVVGLLAFFSAGSGKTVIIEGAKGAAKGAAQAAGAAAMA